MRWKKIMYFINCSFIFLEGFKWSTVDVEPVTGGQGSLSQLDCQLELENGSDVDFGNGACGQE